MTRQFPWMKRAFRASLPAAWLVSITLFVSAAAIGASPSWPPPGGVPMTSWGKEVQAGAPVLPEYPRPQMTRADWLNLNGPWDYAITPRAATLPGPYAGKIRVPFPVESILSQVNQKVDENSRLWYHRTFQIPANWGAQRILLHFGAVDWETTVQVNGKTFEPHRGGYDGFSLDITDALKPAGPQDIVVSVWDPTEGGQPAGKQSRHPEGIFYTPITGIWQTVWLEPVPQVHLSDLKLVPDVDHSQLILTASVDGSDSAHHPRLGVEAAVINAGQPAAGAAGKPDSLILIRIPRAQLWWPDSPFLYDLRVTLRQGGKIIDSVGSYFGMRKISVGPDAKGVTRILLNNQFVLHNGLLDQGFWPDGLYTAPTDSALRSDIEMTRKLGFNMVRKHIKVEPERWYYWADKLGLLVWQDMPCSTSLSSPREGVTIPDMPGQFEHELRRMIQDRFNHPCIVMWILFNEGMGLEMSPAQNETPSPNTRALVARMVLAARQEDSTRLINHESGAGGGGWQGRNPWDIGLGDVIDFHDYGKSNGPIPEPHRASVIGEYGFAVAPVSSVLNMGPQAARAGVSGLVLTQLTDVENEHNGVLNYDRTLKGQDPAEKIGAQIKDALKEWSGSGSIEK